jgi:hypothetical protein
VDTDLIPGVQRAVSAWFIAYLEEVQDSVGVNAGDLVSELREAGVCPVAGLVDDVDVEELLLPLHERDRECEEPLRRELLDGKRGLVHQLRRRMPRLHLVPQDEPRFRIERRQRQHIRIQRRQDLRRELHARQTHTRGESRGGDSRGRRSPDLSCDVSEESRREEGLASRRWGNPHSFMYQMHGARATHWVRGEDVRGEYWGDGHCFIVLERALQSWLESNEDSCLGPGLFFLRLLEYAEPSSRRRNAGAYVIRGRVRTLHEH